IEARQSAQATLMAYISGVVQARRAVPGSDLGSMVVNATVDGQRISEQDAISYMTLLLFGGLDTIASMLGFIMRFLAENPDHRRELVTNLGDQAFLKGAIEELFRRFGIVNAGRVVTRDCDFSGVMLRANDTVLPINMLVGLDDRRIDNPMTVDFARGSATNHLAFGAGPHSCPGSTLARREITIFLQEWLTRLPEFSIAAGGEAKSITGVTCSLAKLDLAWPRSAVS
ncbi:MAG: cytochrome P450, partial [Novosphingobium sp.]